MNIKKEDKVTMLSGKDKGKTGKVLQVMPRAEKVSVEGLNLLVKHLRPNRRGEKGQRIEFPSFVNASKVALICPSCGKNTKVGYKVVKGEKKSRICRRCESAID